jgi:thiamine pyrophosphokinase
MVVYHREEVLYAVSGPLTLPGASPGDRVSLLPLTGVVEGIHTQGLLYPLRGEALPRGSTRGVSNQVVSLPCGVRFSRGRLLVVHAPARPRKEG